MAMRDLSGSSVTTWEKIVQQMTTLRNSISTGAFKFQSEVAADQGCLTLLLLMMMMLLIN